MRHTQKYCSKNEYSSNVQENTALIILKPGKCQNQVCIRQQKDPASYSEIKMAFELPKIQNKALNTNKPPEKGPAVNKHVNRN